MSCPSWRQLECPLKTGGGRSDWGFPLSAVADTLVMAYPNAGLPNELGEYDEAAEETAAQVREWIASGLVNIVGGCCGTTPQHIAAIAGAARDSTPRVVPAARSGTLLAGLEPMLIAA